jgi:hypothetical protein
MSRTERLAKASPAPRFDAEYVSSTRGTAITVGVADAGTALHAESPRSMIR